MKLYFVRHGQYEGSIGSWHDSWAQVPLSEKGKEDAAMAGRLLRGIPFDKVYSSDLRRAVETQRIALPEAEAERLPILREIHMGSLVGKHREACTAEYGEVYLKNLQACDFSPYGGEGPRELQQRIREFLKMMEQSAYENVAVFGHSIYIGTVLDVVNGAGLKKGAFPCDFGSVSVFEFRDGCWRVNAWNCTELSR